MATTSHQTALALQRLVEGLADVSEAVTAATTTEELFALIYQFAPLMETSLALQDRMALKVDALLKKENV